MKKIKILIFFFFINIFFFESTSFILAKYFNLYSSPSYSLEDDNERHWINHKIYGVWHKKDSIFYHKSKCFSAKYFFNEYGAKDKKRFFYKDKSTLVIGDSFTEGYGVSNDKIFTHILDDNSAKYNYFNFSTSGYFGSTQYNLLFQDIKNNINFERVFLFINPSSDFEDDSIEFGRLFHDKKYRPYLDYDKKEIFYFNKDFLEKTQRNLFLKTLDNFTYSYKLIRYTYDQALLLLKVKENKNIKLTNKNYISYYSYFPENEYNILEYNLVKIANDLEKNNKKLYVFSIPSKNDILFYENNILDAKLEVLAKNNNFFYKSFLKDFTINNSFVSKYYFSCNDHLNESGHNLLANTLIKELQEIGLEF
jgi:lysophospholipase L1-like esterase